MRQLIVVLFSFLARVAVAEEPQGRWKLIGTDEVFMSGATYYLIFEEIEMPEDGVYIVPSLTVYATTLDGIDFLDGNGDLYTNTDYPYRSMWERTVIDCNKGMVATIESHFFSTVSPSSDTLVYMEKIGNPLLYPTIQGDVVFAKVCEF